MKNILKSIYPICIGIILVLSVYNFIQIKKTKEFAIPVSSSKAFNKVMESGEIRVGYLISPPYLSKQTSTGQLSGIFYDVTEELGKRLNLKVIWVEEVNLATLSEGLDNGRFEMIAFPLWRSADRAKKVAFSTPILYSTLGCYARADDNRFDNNLDAINSNNIKISTIDGELAESIAKADFPNAKLVPLPALSDYSQMLLQVASNKADISFHNRVDAERYMQKNPGTIKEVSKTPIRVYAECYILPIDDYKFQQMINATVLEMIENNVINKAFKNNGENPNEYFMPALPFKMPTN